VTTDPKNWASEFPQYADFQRWQSADASVRVEADLRQVNELLAGLHVAGFLIQDEIRKLGLEILRRVAARTPVKTGRAKNSWHLVGPNSESDSFTYHDDQGRTFDGSLADGHTGPLEVIVGSNVFYMILLEAGHSRQAPQGMVSITLAEVQGALEARVDAILNDVGEGRTPEIAPPNG